MKNTVKNYIGFIILLLTIHFNASAQEEKVVTNGGGGYGIAKSTKLFKKVIRLVNVDTNEPIKDYFITIAKNNTAFYSTKTNAGGYATIVFNMSNYYPKVEINLNDNKYKRPEWKEDRNVVFYKPLNEIIEFKTKKDLIDTTLVLLKKI
ncbi:hypothetical protein [Pedobacter sp. MW01-1-1]|uniref:hypothetical protein n=1 Tax=Pedobacter sp. MW01-1-1 TaxID=3383027 RepID=UPI003FEEFF2B